MCKIYLHKIKKFDNEANVTYYDRPIHEML